MIALFPDNAARSYNGITYSLQNRKPDKGFSTSKEYSVNTFTSKTGQERRTLLSRRPKRNFSISYTNLNGSYKTAIEDFYSARSGTFESFEFDLTYLGLSGTITVRFDGSLNVSEVLTSHLEDSSFYNVSFNLVETFN